MSGSAPGAPRIVKGSNMTKTKLTNQTSENQTPTFSKKPKKILKKARKDFSNWMAEIQTFKIRDKNYSLPTDIGMRFTAYPLKPIRKPKRIFEIENSDFFRASHDVQIGDQTIQFQFPCYTGTKEPVLRGLKFLKVDIPESFYLTETDEGLIEIAWKNIHDKNLNNEAKTNEPNIIYENWLLALYISLLDEIDKFRLFNSVEDIDFVLEVEILSPKIPFIFYRYNQQSGYGAYKRPYKHWISPKYKISKKSEFNDLVNLFQQDIFDSAMWGNKPKIIAY